MMSWTKWELLTSWKISWWFSSIIFVTERIPICLDTTGASAPTKNGLIVWLGCFWFNRDIHRGWCRTLLRRRLMKHHPWQTLGYPRRPSRVMLARWRSRVRHDFDLEQFQCVFQLIDLAIANPQTSMLYDTMMHSIHKEISRKPWWRWSILNILPDRP